MIGLDTNVLVRFFTADDPEQHGRAKALFATLSRNRRGFISQPVVVEFFWVLRFTYKYSKRECFDALHVLLQSDVIEFDDGECVSEALYEAEEGADFADALIQANARQFQITEMVTFDRQAARRLEWRLL